MQEQLDRIKAHVRKHKTIYIVAGVSLGVGAVAAGSYILGTKTVPKDVATHVSPSQAANLCYKPTMTMEVYVEALGDPDNIIQDLTTGTIYASQGQAAKALGVPASRISKHLSGVTQSVEGHTFVKLGKAMVSDIAE